MTENTPLNQELREDLHITRQEAADFLSTLEMHLDQLQWPAQFTKTIATLRQCGAVKESTTPEAAPDCLSAWSGLNSKHSYWRPLEQLMPKIAVEEPVVFAPGHGSDASHCEAFPHAKKVINLDPDPASVNLMRSLYQQNTRIESHLGIVESFQPAEPIDILFVARPCFSLKSFDYHSFMRPGGYIACDGSANSWSTLQNDPQLQYLGTTCCGGVAFSTSPSATLELRSPKTDRELLDCGPGGEMNVADFSSVFQIVYRITGETLGVIETYNRLRELAAEETVYSIRLDDVDPALAPYLKKNPLRRALKNCDPFTEKGRDSLKKLLLEYYPVTLKRRQQTFLLRPLPAWGATQNDIRLFQVSSNP